MAPFRHLAIIICMMAAKVAYENKAYARDVVNVHWKMHLLGFFQFYNDNSKKNDTQAFICCDRPKDVRLIIVSFRGTEMFNAADWLTDLDLSWISFGEIGRVHLGFMKGLGLHQEETNGVRPKDYSAGNKNNLAYYTIRERLKMLLEENPDAKILVTGHSLGGALAILFVAGLVYHQEAALLNHLLGVYTFGQPRVGDENFGRFMDAKLKEKYFRVVYRYDIVPRLPFGDPITQFAHFGNCIYYSSWYKAQVLREEPNENYINPSFFIPMHFDACLDLLRAYLIPGVSSHCPRDYVNSARLGRRTDQAEDEGKSKDD
ncbi:PREDICTED: lipase-like [Nelumbo nucifera]|uniref:Lipase-like n=1 Tax=Nelumbo nucifera TaxID=4432 RepID=A0A1U8Q0E9_NELNU|nr:PREDICTED: lipase-like [Nelumbo nucifera]